MATIENEGLLADEQEVAPGEPEETENTLECTPFRRGVVLEVQVNGPWSLDLQVLIGDEWRTFQSLVLPLAGDEVDRVVIEGHVRRLRGMLTNNGEGAAAATIQAYAY